MSKNTTKEFIESMNFKYFETYSFQRKGDFDIYETLLNRYIKDENSLTKEEYLKLRSFKSSDLYSEKNNYIITADNKINELAELVYSFDQSINTKNKLVEILQTTFVSSITWMCMPVYRDAILFYDDKHNLIDGINICFECSSIVNLNKERISTDETVYPKLKDFLRSLGHKIKW